MRIREYGVLLMALVMMACMISGCQAPPEDVPNLLEAQSAFTAPSADSFVPLSEIALNTPETFQHAFEDPNFGWSIDAQVILPEDLSRFDVISCGIGAELDLDEVLASRAIPEEAWQAAAGETEERSQEESENFISHERLLGQAWHIMTERNLLWSVRSVPGELYYRRCVPDAYKSSTVDYDNSPIFSNDGVAMDSGLTGEQAKQMALDFMDALPLSLLFGAGQITAVSPGENTEYTLGYYEVQVHQLLDGKPVAIHNESDGASWGGVFAEDDLPFQMGSLLRVFDFGVQQARLRWLSESFQVVERPDRLLSLAAAVEILDDYLRVMGEQSPQGNYMAAANPSAQLGQDIGGIRLEYAATRRDGDRLTLSPCWTFEGMGRMSWLCGFRVNALTGEVLIAHGG